MNQKADPLTVSPSHRITVSSPIAVPLPEQPRTAERVFLFAGGGTGGHIFPGLAIAERLGVLSGGRAKAVFLCSDRPLDAEIARRERVEFRVIPAKPLVFSARGLARFAGSWGAAVRTARSAIRETRRNGAHAELVAMGGFVAAPAVRGAIAERCPVTLVNLDAVPGKANRWIGRRSARVFTAAALDRPGWTPVPPIVRAAARAARAAGECRSSLGLDPLRPTLLVTGGSQGARSINELMIRLLRDHRPAFDGWQALHQCGQAEEPPVRSAYQHAGVPAVVTPFIEDMASAWGAADLAVSRAGAGNVAEAWANGVPAIFLPYPYHRDEHQRANAMPLEKAGGAVVLTDFIDPARNAAEAGRLLVDLMRDDTRRRAMRAAFERLGPADGAERIARVLLDCPGG